MNDQPTANNKTATGSNAINWTTIALIVISGGGNLLQTKAGIDFNEAEIRRATQEIHDLYPLLQEAIRRQKEMQATLDQMKGKP